MGKRDPFGAVKNPIYSKLAAEITRPSSPGLIALSPSDAEPSAARRPPENSATPESAAPQAIVPESDGGPIAPRLMATGRESRTQFAETLRSRSAGGRSTRFKQVKRTPEELEACQQSLRVLGRVFGISVQHGEVDRALWSLLARAEDSIDELERYAPKLVRPHSGDTNAKSELEDAIGNFLLRAFVHYDAS